MNIIFEKVPSGSFTYKTYNLILPKNEITWVKLFDFLEKKTDIPSEYFKLRWGKHMFTLDSEPFNYNNFKNCPGKRDDYLIFSVDYNFDKIRKKREERKFKIGILESSIRSLSASGQTVTDLMMELNDLKSTVL